MANETPPRPLPGPDHLRIENPGTIGLLAIRWYEWEDWSAAAKLVDALQDHGRMDDAREVRRIVAGYLNPVFGESQWRGKVLRLLMWDVYQWNTCCEQMTDAIAAREAKIASDLVDLSNGAVLTFPNGEPVPSADWGVDPADTDDDSVQQIIGFAAQLGFVPRTQNRSPVWNEDGQRIGTEKTITLHRVTFSEDASYVPDDDTDLDSDDAPEPTSPGDAVHSG